MISFVIERFIQLPPMPPRAKGGHKGTYGRVLVIGGSATMIGAPAFAASAAYRSGAGYVQIGTPELVLPHVLALEPEAVGLAIPGDDAAWDGAIEKADAIAIGPGLGQLASGDAIIDFVLASGLPVVLDADALNLLSRRKQWPQGVESRCVLTPHPGEMKRLGLLFGKPEQSQAPDDRIDTALKAAQAFGQTIVYKGEATIVTDGKRVYINRTGDSTLSKAGTGDVLSGIIGTLLAQAHAPFEAACMAVWIHGTAGERAGQALSRRSASPRDVLGQIGDAFTAYEKRFGISADSKSLRTITV